MPVSQFSNSCIHARNMVSLLYGLVQIIKNKLVSTAWVALNKEYNDHTIDRLKNSICSCVFITTIIWWTLSHSATPRRTGSRLRKSSNNFYISLRHLYITYYLNEIPNQAAYSHSSRNQYRKKFPYRITIRNNRIGTRDNVNLNNAIESAIKAEVEYNEHEQRTKITQRLIQSIQCNSCMGYRHDSRTCSTIDTTAQVWLDCSMATENMHLL